MVAAAAPPLPTEVTEASELTELFTPWASLEVIEDTEGLLPWPDGGVEGLEAGAEEYPVPKRRRVEENRRDGSRLEDEYCEHNQGLVSRIVLLDLPTHSTPLRTSPSTAPRSSRQIPAQIG